MPRSEKAIFPIALAMIRRLVAAGLFGLLALAPPAAFAQLDAVRSEFSAALKDAQATQHQGPALVPLLDEASLQIPDNYVFVPMPAAARLLKAMGNPVDPHLVGVVFPGREENWLLVVQFEKTGFIREDDARDWNVDELLRSVREGTERGDAQRRALGLPEIEISGWAEKPRYDTKTHRLVWAIAAHDRGITSDKDTAQGVNYNTYVLGRDGYFKFNLVTDLKDLAGQEAAADAVVASLNYVEGKRYEDFDASHDPAADFSIRSLVAGIVVKKLGFPAVLAAVVANLSMALIAAAILVLLGVAGYFFWRHRSRRRISTDDFPPTQIGIGLDGPTLVLAHELPTVILPMDDTENVGKPGANVLAPGSSPESQAPGDGPSTAPAADSPATSKKAKAAATSTLAPQSASIPLPPSDHSKL